MQLIASEVRKSVCRSVDVRAKNDWKLVLPRSLLYSFLLFALRILVSVFCSFLVRLNALQDTILETKTRLIILDSVASLIRKEFEYDSHHDRNDMLAKEASLLKYGNLTMVVERDEVMISKAGVLLLKVDVVYIAAHCSTTILRALADTLRKASPFRYEL